MRTVGSWGAAASLLFGEKEASAQFFWEHCSSLAPQVSSLDWEGMCVDLCHCALDSAGRGGACASVRCSSLPARSLLRIHIADVRPACSACREAPHHPGAPWDSQTLWGVTTCLALRSASAVRHDSVEVVHGDISSSRPATSSSQASSAPQPPPLPPTPVHSHPYRRD